MRRILLTIIAFLVLAQPVRAEFVKPDVATRCAMNALGMKGAPVLENAVSLRAAGRDGQSPAPEYYVFNNPQGGWVIIASDDRVNPVIGYSPEGSFTVSGMPENLQWWMDGVAGVIDAVRESGADAPESVREAWKLLLAGGSPVTEGNRKFITTALWNQTNPFNDLCPIVSGENKRSITGCVATAMAIVMHSNRWPQHGKGEIGNYTTITNPTIIPASDINSHYYDWDIMWDENVVNGKTSQWTSAQTYQVAQLMYDCGVAVQTDFTSESSSASSGKMLKAIQENMSYSDKSVIVSRSSYTLDKWFSLMKNEIDNGRVIFYGGNGDSGGHGFVCDGYDTNGSQLRINWGWGGECNGYYTLDLTIPKYGLGFSDMQEAVIGLAPNTAQVELEETMGLVCISLNGLYGIEPIVPADLTAGSEINFRVGWIMNNNNRDVKAEFKVCLEDKDGNVRQDGWHLTIEIPASNGYAYTDRTEKKALEVTPDMTDHFRLYVRKSNGEWAPMPGNYDLLPGVDGIICGVIQDPLIMVPDDCAAGQEIELSLSLGFAHVKSVKWSLNGTALEGNKVKMVSGKNNIRADVEYMDDSTGSIFRTLQLE